MTEELSFKIPRFPSKNPRLKTGYVCTCGHLCERGKKRCCNCRAKSEAACRCHTCVENTKKPSLEALFGHWALRGYSLLSVRH